MLKLHLAIDIGSESGRATVGYIENDKLMTKEIHRFKTQFMTLRDVSVRNFYRFHEEIIKALKIFASEYGNELSSIGVDAWGGDFVLLNRAGEINRLPESYRNVTSSADVDDIVEKKFGIKSLYFRNGNQIMPNDTLTQLIRLRVSDDPSLDDPHTLLFVSDLFHYFLGAKPCCEHSLASYSRLYNINSKDWDYDVLRAFDLPATITNEIVYAGDKIGSVSQSILADAGIKGNVDIITPCSHDTSCAALAIPDCGDEWAFLSSGTWSLLGLETDLPIVNDFTFESNFSNSSMPVKANMFKKNITGTWIIQQCCQKWEMYDYNQIVQQAEAADDIDAFIDVNSEEFYSSADMPNAISCAVKHDFDLDVSPLDIGTVSRIVFQSMALKYRFYLSKLLKASGKSIKKIYVLGGGSKNRLLNQFTANACGYMVSAGVYEASTTGNLLLQAFGSGELKDVSEMRQIVINTFPQNLYYPQNAEKWAEKFEVFLRKAAKKNLW